MRSYTASQRMASTPTNVCVMSAFPTIESLLLQAHQALGAGRSGFKLKTDDREGFADIGLSEERQQAITQRLLADIQSTFALDDESTAYFFKALLEWSNHHKHLELNTWTSGASARQVTWYLASRSIVPTLARVLAFWDLDGALAPGMPTGQFWFLPTTSNETGLLELPLPKVVDWLVDLYGIPVNQLQQHLGSDDDARKGRQDSLLRNLYNWKAGKLPRVTSIEDMFPDDATGTQTEAFGGVFAPEPSLPNDQRLAAALDFVGRRALTLQDLSQQIQFPNIERLSAVLSGEGTDEENLFLVNALRIRYAAPSQRTIRQRLLLARAVQSTYMSLCEFLCPDVEPSCTDLAANKVLQLGGLFTRVFNLTIHAHDRVPVPNEKEEDLIFEAALNQFERRDLLLDIVPSRKHVSYLEVPSLWSRRFARMSGSEPLEDLMPTHPAGVDEFVQAAMVRLLREEDEDRRVSEVVERCRRSSSWRAFQEQGFDVLRGVIGVDNLSPKARVLACERLQEVAESPEQRADAALQRAVNLLATKDAERSAALATQIDELLGLAHRTLQGTHHQPLLLATRGKQLLRKGLLKDAQVEYRKALDACSSWGCGRLRGEIARDLLAIEVADAALPMEEHSSAGKYYRNMVAFGMFETKPSGLEDTAIWAHSYFWTDLFRPYRGVQSIKSPQTTKSQDVLKKLAKDIVYDGGFDGRAWLDQNRKTLSKQRLRDVRGDSVLTFLLKFVALMRKADVPDAVGRMRSFVLMLIAAWPEQVKFSDFKSQSPLMLAANDGEIEIVRSLLVSGANVDAQDYLGRTPLHAAVTGDSLPCVELLLAAAPDVSRTTYDEAQSVLHTAIRIGNVSVITALVEAFPELQSTRNMHGDTPIHQAQWLLDHYDLYCSMMASQSGRSPASPEVLTEIVVLLRQLAKEGAERASVPC